ncbi:histidine phosphatase family protein [Mycolicibacterium thermoresistibile]
MSGIVRLSLVSHAMTDAVAAGRFPVDEPLNPTGRQQIRRAESPVRVDRVWCGPEQRTRQTAELLGLTAVVEPRLTDLDHGRWSGLPLPDVPVADLAIWRTDPRRAPHGGETIAALLDRVGGWLDGLTGCPGRVVAVTHPAVVRAAVLLALDAPTTSFWRVDVAPVSRTVLHHRDRGWTLRLAG